MIEFRWIIFSLFLMLLFGFTDAEPRRYTVRVGDEVTLSCGNFIDDQRKCGSTTWLLWESGQQTVKLIDRGQIHKEAKTNSDRLSVTENCSLVMKKVTVEDAGLYTCGQIRVDTTVFLFVVTMTEHEEAGKVTLNCSVSPPGLCYHTVKWLYEGEDVNKDNRDMETSQSECLVTVTFQISHLKQKPDYHELFRCEVTDRVNVSEVQQFNFNRQSPGEKTGDDATTPISPTTIKSTSTTGSEWTSVKLSPSEVWWRFIIVSVGLSALLISVVTVNIWTRTKGNKTQTDENTEHNDEDEDEGTVKYENVGEPSVSVRLH